MKAEILLCTHEGRVRVREHATALDADGRASAVFAGATWQVEVAAQAWLHYDGITRTSSQPRL